MIILNTSLFLILIMNINNSLLNFFFFIPLVFLFQYNLNYTNSSTILQETSFNLYDLIKNKIISELSEPENYFLIFYSISSLLIILMWINNTQIIAYHKILKIILIILIIIYNSSNIITEYNSICKAFNIILDHTIASIHTPFILFSLQAIKIYIYALYINILKKKKNEKKTINFLLLIITISILLGSIWSSNIFGWGGSWTWDPIEIISYVYWITFFTISHTYYKKSITINYILFLYSMDYLFFCINKMNMLKSLHIFKTNTFNLNANYFFFIFILLVILSITYIFFNQKKKSIIDNLSYVILYTLIWCCIFFTFNGLNIVSFPYSMLNIILINTFIIIVATSFKYIELNFKSYLIIIFFLFYLITYKINIIIILLISIYLLTMNEFKNKYSLAFFATHMIPLIIVIAIINYHITEIHFSTNSWNIINTNHLYLNVYEYHQINDYTSNTSINYSKNNLIQSKMNYNENNLINCYYFSPIKEQTNNNQNELTLIISNHLNNMFKYEFNIINLITNNHINYILFICLIIICCLSLYNKAYKNYTYYNNN
uniref:Uncharacterized protein n=1 Tax=Stachyamoeba lipophora TaxID=463046 RepID=A0A0B5GNP2_STALP|nr:hypothetical protein [Stachyamoeba lipophora]AJF22894.1 hypothetical protein [Stachyamoeba lipophora]